MLPGHDTNKTEATSVIGQLFGWLDAGRKAALAVVVETWGSSPRPAGSLLAVNDKGAFVGSVSGGCVENAVVAEALELMKKDGFKSLHFGVADENAWKVGLACGGEVRVFVVVVTQPWREALRGLLDAGRDKNPAALLVDLETSEPGLMVAGDNGQGAAAQVDWLAAPVKAALEADRGGIVEGPGGKRQFVGVFNPPLRLLVIGAVHIAQSLARIAAEIGFEVVVIDPRGAWATEARFPGVTIDRRWPNEALAELKPDRRTAVVSLSHDPKLDDPALLATLKTEAFYIGALGSRRTHDNRLKRLIEAGADAQALKRIRGPVGLAIGALTPAEIALSIMGEIVATHRPQKKP
jgi:xanthine dehydrogenase accessory factor